MILKKQSKILLVGKLIPSKSGFSESINLILLRALFNYCLTELEKAIVSIRGYGLRFEWETNKIYLL